MSGKPRWNFTQEQLLNTPSRKHGFDYDKEMSHRQQAANFIQDVGERGLKLSLLTTNTAIVYMHRFYVFHSFRVFQRYTIAAAALFLACKTEEQLRFVEQVIKTTHYFLTKERLEVNSASYKQQADELILNEQILLETLGFDLHVEHPHAHILRLTSLVNANKELSHACWCMASYIWHLTMMCLQYSPKLVACVCVNIACLWSGHELPQGINWFKRVDSDITLHLIEAVTQEFVNIVKQFPKTFKNKMIFSDKFKVPYDIMKCFNAIDELESTSSFGNSSSTDSNFEVKAIQIPFESFSGNVNQPPLPKILEKCLSKTDPLNLGVTQIVASSSRKQMYHPSMNISKLPIKEPNVIPSQTFGCGNSEKKMKFADVSVKTDSQYYSKYNCNVSSQFCETKLNETSQRSVQNYSNVQAVKDGMTALHSDQVLTFPKRKLSDVSGSGVPSSEYQHSAKVQKETKTDVKNQGHRGKERYHLVTPAWDSLARSTCHEGRTLPADSSETIFLKNLGQGSSKGPIKITIPRKAIQEVGLLKCKNEKRRINMSVCTNDRVGCETNSNISFKSEIRPKTDIIGKEGSISLLKNNARCSKHNEAVTYKKLKPS